MGIKKSLLLFIFLTILAVLPLVVFAQDSKERGLEIDYLAHEEFTPTTIESTPIGEYIKYIFNISFGIAGIIGFLVLIYAGFGYLTSTGDPKKMSESKKRIISVFLGLGILISSYLLLITINPDITIFNLPSLEEIIFPPKQTISPGPINSELLGTVKEIGVLGKISIEKTDNAANYIFSSTLQCLCVNAKSLCLCEGGGENDRCLPKTCYVGRDNSGHPCRDYREIKKNQELIIFWLNELIGYQNRASAEIDNLKKDILDIIGPQIAYYQKIIPTQTNQAIIDNLNLKLKNLQKEKVLKQDLISELFKFITLIDFLKTPVKEISELPEQCAVDTPTKCNAKCLPGSACHDTFIGCMSICFGVNPCPFVDIGVTYGKIDLIQKAISSSTEEIVSIVEKIRELKTGL